MSGFNWDRAKKAPKETERIPTGMTAKQRKDYAARKRWERKIYAKTHQNQMDPREAKALNEAQTIKFPPFSSMRPGQYDDS